MRDVVLAALTAFLVEHQHCGELDGGRDGGTIWLECSCGGRIAHPGPQIEDPYAHERHPR